MNRNQKAREGAMEQLIKESKAKWPLLLPIEKEMLAGRVAAKCGISLEAAIQRLQIDPCACGSTNFETIETEDKPLVFCVFCGKRIAEAEL